MTSLDAIPASLRVRTAMGAAVTVLAMVMSACGEPQPANLPDNPDENAAMEVVTEPDPAPTPAPAASAPTLANFEGAARMPRGLEPLIAGELASMWTQCGDTLVTAFRNRAGRAHAYAFIEAGELSVRLRRAAAEEDSAQELGPEVDWIGTVHLRAGTQRIYQREDRPINPATDRVTRSGWNDLVDNRSPLPAWSIERRNGQWVVTRFMPNWTEERAEQYRVQHTAVDCARVPAR